ncbi:Mu transposase domain-containing protein [Thermaerobacter litoralis]
MPDFPDWEALNAHLLAWCERERQRRQEAWEQERAALRPLPDRPFRAARPHVVTVNKLSLVTFDRNRYSVPCEWVGRTLTLWAYTDRVEVTDGERLVATHSRVYGRGETRLELAHYLPALARKPRAATHLAVVPTLPPVYAQVQRLLCSRRPDGYREFAQVLLLHREFPARAVAEALEEAAAQGLLEAQAVRQLILNRLARPVPEPVPVPERFAAVQVRTSDPACYDALLGGNPR